MITPSAVDLLTCSSTCSPLKGWEQVEQVRFEGSRSVGNRWEQVGTGQGKTRMDRTFAGYSEIGNRWEQVEQVSGLTCSRPPLFYINAGNRSALRFCTVEKMEAKMVGSVKRADSFYSSTGWLGVRRKVLSRDGWKCVWCATPVHGKGKARVDHIQPLKTHPHLALDPGNLRSLCIACDAKRHKEKAAHLKERWQEQKPEISEDGFPPEWR